MYTAGVAIATVYFVLWESCVHQTSTQHLDTRTLNFSLIVRIQCTLLNSLALQYSLHVVAHCGINLSQLGLIQLQLQESLQDMIVGFIAIILKRRHLWYPIAGSLLRERSNIMNTKTHNQSHYKCISSCCLLHPTINPSKLPNKIKVFIDHKFLPMAA